MKSLFFFLENQEKKASRFALRAPHYNPIGIACTVFATKLLRFSAGKGLNLLPPEPAVAAAPPPPVAPTAGGCSLGPRVGRPKLPCKRARGQKENSVATDSTFGGGAFFRFLFFFGFGSAF